MNNPIDDPALLAEAPATLRSEMIVNCVAYAGGEAHSLGRSLDVLPEWLQRQDAFVWLGLYEPDEVLLQAVRQMFGLHELAVEDAHHAHQRPKLEEYGESLFIVLQTAQQISGAIQLGETHLFISARFIVSIRHGASSSYRIAREHCEKHPRQLALGPGYPLYSIMDFVVDNLQPIVDHLAERVEMVEDEIFNGNPTPRELLARMYVLKRKLMMLRNAAYPLGEISHQLMTIHQGFVPPELRPYFRDVNDHVRRVVSSLDAMREILANVMQVHLALITVQQNEVVKQLAGWGAILAIPTMIFSLYGMNFQHMPELHTRFGYPLALSVTLAGCMLLYRRLKRAGWL